MRPGLPRLILLGGAGSVAANPYPAAIAAYLSAITATGYLSDGIWVGFGAPNQVTGLSNVNGGAVASLILSGGSTWSTTEGFMPDGVSASISIGTLAWNANGNYKTSPSGSSSCGIISVHKENVQSNGLVGTASNANLNHNPRSSGDTMIGKLQSSTGGTVANTSSIGTFISRRVANTLECFANAVSLGTSSVTTQTPTTSVMQLGRVASTFSNRKTLILIIGAAPTDQQVIDITAANKAYCNAITPGTLP